MKVLVTVASKHGATTGIGEAIAETLRSKGLYVAVIEPQRVESVEEFDAVIVGSGIYMGRWLAAAREFVEDNAVALGKKPVWLFGSGPIIGTLNAPNDGADAAEGKKLQDLIGAHEAKVFAGEREIGFITSAAKSPRSGPIALGYVHRDFLTPGTAVEVELGERRARALIA